MEIGVITFFQSYDNYGQLLQCYSLQKVLRDMGHSPYIIRYGFEHPYFMWYRKRYYLSRDGLISLIKDFKNSSKIQDIRKFNKFRKQYLRMSKLRYNNVTDLRRIPPRADCYIAGSDQIWAQLVSNYNNRSFFLDFGSEKIRRVSYAPSFAMDEYPTHLIDLLSNLLSQFNAISVREDSGARICNSAKHTAKVVLDPTMLLSTSDYRVIAQEQGSNTKYCFIYHVNVNNPSDLYWDDCLNYNRVHKIKSVACWANAIKDIDMEFLTGATYVYPSICEWISLIADAEYCLTTSFHGVVFSIIFHKPFVVCLRTKSQFDGNDRIISLLNKLGLTDRIATNSIDFGCILSRDINWSIVDNKLNKLRAESLDFLKSSLR